MACPSLTIRNVERVDYEPGPYAPEHNDEHWQFPSTLARIFCPTGFTRFPLVNPRCQNSGIWDPPPPVCSGKEI